MSGTVAPEVLSPLDESRPRQPSRLRRLVGTVAGWAWRLLVGTFLCFNAPVLSLLTSVLVVGWLQRWVRARVLFRWWNASPVREQVPFEEIGETYRDRSPVLLPRWFLPEKLWGSAVALWLNFRHGLLTLLCVYLVLGVGCLVMFFSWEMGWIISAYKGYEEAWIGITSGLIGSLLFILGFLYLPLARTHAAVVGDARAFFDARVVWGLIRARPASFSGLILLITLAALPLEVMRVSVLKMGSDWERLNDAQLLAMLSQHLRGMAFVLFVSLLLTHALAARVYRKSLVVALREGWLTPEDLGPRLYCVLSRLELLPERAQPKRGLVRILRWTWRWYTRRFFFAAMFLLGVVFVLKVYAGYFFVASPFVGFMNHPLLQFPCVDYVPRHLLP
jgi:hypothetical protein